MLVWLFLPFVLGFCLFFYCSCRLASDYDRESEKGYREQLAKGVMNT